MPVHVDVLTGTSFERTYDYRRASRSPDALDLAERLGVELSTNEDVFDGFGLMLHALIANGEDSDRNLRLIFGRKYLENIGRARLQDLRAAVEVQSCGLDWYDRGYHHSFVTATLEAGSAALLTVNKFKAGTLTLPPTPSNSTYFADRHFFPPPSTTVFESRVDLFTGARRFVLKDSLHTALLFAAFSSPRNGQPDARGYWSVVAGPFGAGNRRLEQYGALEPSSQKDTNQRAALQALVEALDLEPWRSLGFKRVIIAMSSEYTVLGLAERVDGWKARGWRLRDGRPTANVDLWEKVLDRVEFWERFGVEILMWNVRKGTNKEVQGLLRKAESEYGQRQYIS